MLSKFLNVKTLLILLGVLVIAYLIAKFTESEDRTFKSEMVSIDSALVTKMIITPKLGETAKEVVFTRTGSEWRLESDGKSFIPDPSAVKNILSEMMKMKSERVAAIDKSKWNEFEVSDSTATRVKIYNGKKQIADLYVGKFSYAQPQGQQQNPYQQNKGKMSTYVRPAGDNEVYVVDGFIKMSIQPNVNAYRNKTLFASNKDDLNKLSFTYPDGQGFILAKEENKWLLNGVPADSALTVKYLNKLARVTSSNYIDEVTPLTSTPTHTLRIEGNNFSPVEIKAFPADTVNKYVVTSNLVPDAKYSGAKAGLFERIFIKKEDFYPAVNEK
ncbi:MAG: DUF4340 domain-containing protein [Bacteroidetes bacterium]|nr:DUF4340 domain-containing protein [Bacteroidota bacterium]